jgi:hypothetical protein
MRHLKKIALVGLLILGFQNCARVPFGGSGSSDQSSSLGAEEAAVAAAMAADPVATPYALLTGEQVLKSMLNVSGAPITTAITNEYNSRANVFSLGPDLKQTTSPMMVAATSIGGEVCNSLITTETPKAPTARLIFGDVNLGGAGAAVSSTQFDAVIRSMARNFWGRNETTEERALIETGKGELGTVTAKVLMLYTCAAMISSVDALTY